MYKIIEYYTFIYGNVIVTLIFQISYFTNNLLLLVKIPGGL